MEEELDPLDALTARLTSLPKHTAWSHVLAVLDAAEPTPVVEMRRRCALVRWFDRDVFVLLSADVPEAPPLDEFVAGGGVRRLAPGRWCLDTATAARLLEEWKASRRDEWQQWNQRLGDYFRRLDQPAARVDALYHLAASPHPEHVVGDFRAWFKEADDAFDLAQCFGLLEVLRVQQGVRGTALSQAWQECDRYYQARSLFADDYYKTSVYFDRPEPFREFKKVLGTTDRGEHNPWIFHIHATGGMGKTMFLRWLVARYLVPERIPCARVDFDEIRDSGVDVVEFPLTLFTRIVEQWSPHIGGTGLSSLLLQLRKDEQTTGWKDSVLLEIARQLQGLQASGLLTGSIVVILDTLEEVTLGAGKWLDRCLRALRQLHDRYPPLVVVLSGRYDIRLPVADLSGEAGVGPDLLADECLVYEMPRFTELEAHAYLESRGIPPSPARDAIVERAAEDESAEGGEGGEAGASGVLAGRNPFKLAMFAELALSRDRLTEEQVRAFPRVDIAYLIERVIKRIPSQPLRWAIRYGAAGRHLTEGFIDHVLLPPLRRALRGEQLDLPNVDLGDAVWTSEPELADSLTAADLFRQLATFARDRGWISLVPTDAGPELRFHSDVVNPTRTLLRPQPVFPELQRRAIEFFEQGARAGLDAASPSDVDIDRAIRNRCEAVFHHFQLEGPAARDYWLDAIREAERFGPTRAIPVAAEITGREYARRAVEPIALVASAEVLAAGHCETADLLLQAAGTSFARGHDSYAKFVYHVASAEEIERRSGGPPVPPMLRAILHAASAETPAEAAGILEAALAAAVTPRERFFLTLRLASWRAILRDPSAVALHRDALSLLPRVERVGLGPADVELVLAELHQDRGEHANATAAYQRARESAAGDPRLLARVLSREAIYALEVSDAAAAWARIAELERLPEDAHAGRPTRFILAARAALLMDNPVGALDAIGRAGEIATQEPTRAVLRDLQGVSYALLFQFNRALDAWEGASAAYDRAGIATGAARCLWLTARLQATTIGNLAHAESLAQSALRLRGAQDAEVYAEVNLILALVAARRADLDLARRIWRDLTASRLATWPARLRARALLFGLAFAIEEPTDARMAAILQVVADIQPPTARLGLLDLCEYSDAAVVMPQGALERLLALLAEADERGGATVRGLVERAHLCRVSGKTTMGLGLLEQADRTRERGTSVIGVIERWRLNAIRLRFGVPTDFPSLPSVARRAFAETPLYDAIRLEAAAAELTRGATREAAAIVGEGFPLIEQQVPSVWQGRVLELRASLQPDAEAEELWKAAVELYTSLGDAARAKAVARSREDRAPRPPSEHRPAAGPSGEESPEGGESIESIRLTMEELSPAVRSAVLKHESTIDRMLEDWPHFGRDLDECVKRAQALPSRWPRVRLDLAPPVAALPWELASTLADRELVWRAGATSRPMPPAAGARVLLMQPERFSLENRLESASGGSLEQIYSEHLPDFESIENPLPERFQRLVQDRQPAVVHVTAAMHEGFGNIYLDFESSQSRADDIVMQKASFSPSKSELAGGRPQELLWTSSRLTRALGNLKHPPLVILDIARPSSLAEGVRMLLLRNLFAAQLFELGSVRAILAVGLAEPWQRLELTERLVRGLASHGCAGAMQALRDPRPSPPAFETQSLDAVLPRFASALWTHDPDTRVLGDGPG